MRRAAFIYLWRGQGFHADLSRPLRADRAKLAASYTTDIIANVKGILSMGSDPAAAISTALLWPLVVVACETSVDDSEQHEEIQELLGTIRQQFAVDHIEKVQMILQILWDRKRGRSAAAQVNHALLSATTSTLSLESIAREQGLVISLH